MGSLIQLACETAFRIKKTIYNNIYKYMSNLNQQDLIAFNHDPILIIHFLNLYNEKMISNLTLLAKENL